jgi:hypothetical protein
LQAGQAAGIARRDVVAGVGERHEALGLVIEQPGDAVSILLIAVAGPPGLARKPAE